MTELVPYDQARVMLAEAKAVDDVKGILDKFVAIKEYARRAGDHSLEIDAAEIRFHAERRLGQMITAQKQAVGLHAGGRPPEKTPTDTEGVSPIKLADAGISHKLSSHAQKMAAVPPDQFEARIGAWREEVAAGGARVTVDLLKIGEEEQQRASRRNIAAALSDTSHELTGTRTFPCVYADPAWKRKAGIGNRAYENHYRTEDWPAIIRIMERVAPQLQDDAWAFIWIPRAHMLALHPVSYTVEIDDGSRHEVTIKIPLIWAIARALGMENYSTCFVWTKTDEEHEDEIGTGLVVRDQDEILCLFKKGRGLPKPASDEKFGSNHRERSRPLGHSTKPKFYRRMIKTMVGVDTEGKPLPVLELFARNDPDNPLPENWEAWGNESAAAPAQEAAE